MTQGVSAPYEAVSAILEVDELAARVEALLKAGRQEEANRLAMDASDAFLKVQPERAREALFRKVFLPLSRGYATQYQPYDFEVVDYELYRFAKGFPLVRGPRPDITDITRGNYAVVLGAAQLFGRFHPVSINTLLRDRFQVPVLNLSVGGAGPLLFADNPAVIAACARARFVVLQVLSGRSIGCDEYPGERMTAPAAKPGTPRRDRNEILAEIWGSDRNEAIRLVKKWNANYVDAYVSLIKKIGRPVILAWISDRSPDHWQQQGLETKLDLGHFPHLVSRQMIDAIRSSAYAYVEGQRDQWLGLDTASRLTGLPCPFLALEGGEVKQLYRNNYYASRQSVEDIVGRLAPAVDRLLR